MYKRQILLIGEIYNMKKCLLSILLATVLLCACAQQTDNTLQTPESSTLVELTVATEETAIETPVPLATESPAPAPTQTAKRRSDRCGNHLGCPNGTPEGLQCGLSGNRVPWPATPWRSA